jgi:hypothetical protein
MQGLFAGKGLCVQEEPLGGPAAAEDFRERPAVNVVAGRAMSAWASRAHDQIAESLAAHSQVQEPETSGEWFVPRSSAQDECSASRLFLHRHDQLSCDCRHRHTGHGKVRGVGVPQDMKSTAGVMAARLLASSRGRC